MTSLNIYVAGPVLRPDGVTRKGYGPESWEHQRYAAKIHETYGEMSAAASLANVGLQIPFFDAELDRLDAREFTAEITRRIELADAMIVMVLREAPGSDARGYSIACEAQMGAEAGKPIAIVADEPKHVPRLLRALAVKRKVWSLDEVSYSFLFTDLAHRADDDDRPHYHSGIG